MDVIGHKKEWYILIDGEKIPVSKDIYLEYYRPVWRESKRRAVRAEMECSLEMMAVYGRTLVDTVADVADIVAGILQMDKLYAALSELTDTERDLITALYIRGKSEREYASESGIPQKTISNHKKRILERLRRKLNDF